MTDRQPGSLIPIQPASQTGRHPGSQTVSQTLSDRQTDRHEFRQTESQTNGKSDKQNVRQTESCKEVRQTVCQTDTKSVRHKVRQTESLTDRKSYRQWRWGTPSCIPQLSSQLKVTKVSHPVVPSWPWTWCGLLGAIATIPNICTMVPVGKLCQNTGKLLSHIICYTGSASRPLFYGRNLAEIYLPIFS